MVRQVVSVACDRVSTCITSCYNTVRLRTAFQTRSVLLQFSYFQNISIVYKYKYQSNVVYMGPTNQMLETRIAQHVPTYLRFSCQSRSLRSSQSVHDSSIGLHIFDNQDCAAEYDDTLICFTERSLCPPR